MISRLDLRGGSFSAGVEYSVWEIEDLRITPFICYENVYPDFTRKRVNYGNGANLMVNITNDGWFGRSSGPYQHAVMAQMRSIENGISLARSANSGITMHVDPYGRILSQTKLYTRDIVVRDIPTYRIMTYYTRYGDWFVIFCAILAAAGIFTALTQKRRPGEITAPLLVEEQKLLPVNICRAEGEA
jgi:apolipoprotein N-acyltransferase